MKFFKKGGMYIVIYLGCVIGQIAMYINGKFNLTKTILVIGLYTILLSISLIFHKKKQKFIEEGVGEDFKL